MKYIYITLLVLIALLVIWSVGQALYISKTVKEPTYTTTTKADGYDIRAYDPYIVASVTITPETPDPLNVAFGFLGGYIFGDNQGIENNKIAMTAPVIDQPGQTIAMTTPVVSEQNADGRVVSFVMPAEYTVDDLPTPNKDEVTFTEVPTTNWAVLRYSGLARDTTIEKKLNQLTTLLERDGISYTEKWQSARYDPPSTLPFLRRNEIWIEVNQ